LRAGVDVDGQGALHAFPSVGLFGLFASGEKRSLSRNRDDPWHLGLEEGRCPGFVVVDAVAPLTHWLGVLAGRREAGFFPVLASDPLSFVPGKSFRLAGGLFLFYLFYFLARLSLRHGDCFARVLLVQVDDHKLPCTSVVRVLDGEEMLF
jgi:hypothetical protein